MAMSQAMETTTLTPATRTRRHHSWPSSEPALRSSISTNWRFGVQSPAEPPANKYEVGQILYLPEASGIPANSVCWLTEQDRGAYGHPAVVTSIQDNGNLGVMVITSFGGTPLTDRYRNSMDAKRLTHAYIYLACGPREDARFRHPDPSMPELTLRGVDRLDKHSYVRYDREIVIEPDHMGYLKIAGHCNPNLHLSPQSIGILVSRHGTIARLNVNANTWKRTDDFSGSAFSSSNGMKRRPMSSPACLSSNNWRQRT